MQSGIPILALAYMDKWGVQFSENEVIEKLKGKVSSSFRKAIVSNAQVEVSAVVYALADYLTDETLFWRQPSSLADLKLDGDESKAGQRIVEAFGFRPEYGNSHNEELQEAYSWRYRWQDSDSRMSASLTSFYIDITEQGLVAYADLLAEGRNVVFPLNYGSGEDAYKLLGSKLKDEKDPEIVRQVLEKVSLHHLLNDFFTNQHLTSSQKTAILVSLYEDGHTALWDVGDYIGLVRKSNLAVQEKVTILQDLLPIDSHPYGISSLKESWDIFKTAYPERSIFDNLVHFYKSGGVVDLGNPGFMTKEELEMLANLPDDQRKKIALEMKRLVEYQIGVRPHKFGAESNALDTVCKLYFLPRYQLEHSGEYYADYHFFSDPDKFFPEDLSFEEGIQEILSLPVCHERDVLIARLAKEKSRDSGAEDIFSFAKHMQPIGYGKESDPLKSAISNIDSFGSLTGGLDIVSPDGDPKDYFEVGKVAYSLRTSYLNRAIQSLDRQYLQPDANLSEVVDRLYAIIPEQCKFRDIYVQRYITQRAAQFMKPDGSLDKERLAASGDGNLIIKEIDKVLPTLVDASAKTMLGYIGARFALAINQQFDHDAQKQIVCVERYLPFFTFRKDELIASIADNSWTTLDELVLLGSKRLANNYRADSPDVVAHRGGAEAGRIIAGALDRKERSQFLSWLFDESKTPHTVDEALAALDNPDRETVSQRLGKDRPDSLEEMREKSTSQYVKAMQKGLPGKIRSVLRQDYHITSFREKFAMMNRWERRELLYDFLTGAEGIFDPRDQAKYKAEDEAVMEGFLGDFFDAAFRHEEQAAKGEPQLTKDVFVQLMLHLSPDRRTNIFCDLTDAIVANGRRSTDPPQLIKRFMETYGIAGVKLGQILAEQQDLLPIEYQRALSGLKESVNPVSKIFTVQVLEEERITQDYPKIGPLLGSASIRQVYEASDQSGNRRVAKFKRPNAEETLAGDFQAIVHVLDYISGRYPEVAGKIPQSLIPRLEQTIRQELDFALETSVTNQMHQSLPRIPFPYNTSGYRFHAAQVYSPGRSVIFEDYVRGVSLDAIEADPTRASELRTIQRALVQSFFYQAFVIGRYHADPHRGNSRVEGKNIGMIDFGLTGEIPSDQRGEYFNFLMGLNNGDSESLSNIIASNIQRNTGSDEREQIEREIDNLGDSSDPNYLARILSLIGTKRVDINLITFVKALIQEKPMVDSLDSVELGTIIAPYYVRLKLIPQFRDILARRSSG